jgi:16S rRNA (guanine527-N7)-methyltransferase
MADDATRTIRLARYRDLLLQWTARVNLIGPEARRNLDDHIAEAIEAAELLKPEGNVLDFGSGGGLPAIPMAIAFPGIRLHMVEADQKKWAFLKHVVRECELNSVVHGDRLERVLPRLDPSLTFSLVTSRAVGEPGVWIPRISSRIVAGGRVALFQGNAEVPIVDRLEHDATFRLSRGNSNYLVVLKMFHVEHHG